MVMKSTIHQLAEKAELLTCNVISDKEIQVICPDGHNFAITYINLRARFYKGSRGADYCKRCSSVKLVNNTITGTGFRWVSGEYINDQSKLTFECDAGHQFQMRPVWLNLRKYWEKIGTRGKLECQQCTKKVAGAESLVTFARSKGAEVVDAQSHKNLASVMQFRCIRNGHTWSKRVGLFKYHSKCPECPAYQNWYETTKPLLPKNVSFVKHVDSKTASVLVNGVLSNYSINDLMTLFGLDLFGMHGLTKLSEPEDTGKRAGREKFQVRCSEGHTFATTRRYLLEGHGCKACAFSGLNKPETEIKQFFESRGHEVKPRVLFKDGKQTVEVDLLVPGLKLGVEFVGIKWHSVEQKHRSYTAGKRSAETADRKVAEFIPSHQNKTIFCQSQDVYLIHIFESDYEYHRERVYEMLEQLAQGRVVETIDLRYCRYQPGMSVSPPRPHYYDKKRRELPAPTEEACHTVYDCGVVLK